MTLQEHLESLNACKEAREWAGNRTARQAWDECEKADWLLWWAERTPANGKVAFVRSACEIARTVLHLVPAGEDRPRLAIEAAEAWCENHVAAARAARAASDAARAAASDAARAAARAARDAAWAAAWAARAAALAAALDAAWDARDAARDAASDAADKEHCAIVRRHLGLPWEES